MAQGISNNSPYQYDLIDRICNRKLLLDWYQHIWHNTSGQNPCTNSIVFPVSHKYMGRLEIVFPQSKEKALYKCLKPNWKGKHEGTLRSSLAYSVLHENMSCPEFPHLKQILTFFDILKLSGQSLARCPPFLHI